MSSSASLALHSSKLSTEEVVKYTTIFTAGAYLTTKLFTAINPVAAATFIGSCCIVKALADKIFNREIFLLDLDREIFLLDLGGGLLCFLAANYIAKFTINQSLITAGLSFISGLAIIGIVNKVFSL
ncbi:hypothetical protein LCGC14_1758320 [marine sediment metagenome]|uniref:Uncharacterized protein n=1 Tax=marine sediment metagenome TaxID=412755 RepID=A0A0F9H1U4_9ZZZZ|nr:hypothetical protein [Chlamydiota bacterium]